MAVEFTLNFTDRVSVLPKATLGDGTEVTNYATRTVMEVQGVSGDYSATRGDWVNLADPVDMTSADFVPWSTFEASRPAALQPLMDSYFDSVSATVVDMIESQFNAPVSENVPAWAGSE
mgnify:CR=1 FL=1